MSRRHQAPRSLRPATPPAKRQPMPMMAIGSLRLRGWCCRRHAALSGRPSQSSSRARVGCANRIAAGTATPVGLLQPPAQGHRHAANPGPARTDPGPDPAVRRRDGPRIWPPAPRGRPGVPAGVGASCAHGLAATAHGRRQPVEERDGGGGLSNGRAKPRASRRRRRCDAPRFLRRLQAAAKVDRGAAYGQCKAEVHAASARLPPPQQAALLEAAEADQVAGTPPFARLRCPAVEGAIGGGIGRTWPRAPQTPAADENSSRKSGFMARCDGRQRRAIASLLATSVVGSAVGMPGGMDHAAERPVDQRAEIGRGRCVGEIERCHPYLGAAAAPRLDGGGHAAAATRPAGDGGHPARPASRRTRRRACRAHPRSRRGGRRGPVALPPAAPFAGPAGPPAARRPRSAPGPQGLILQLQDECLDAGLALVHELDGTARCCPAGPG